MVWQRKKTGPIAAKLGFKNASDCQFFSKKLVQYWRNSYEREQFIKLGATELSVIAESFLLSEGPQIWNGNRVPHPIWPTSLREEKEWIRYAKALLTKFLEGQQFYQYETIRKEWREAGGHGSRPYMDVVMNDDTSYVEQWSQTSGAFGEDQPAPEVQEETIQPRPLVRETTIDSQSTTQVYKPTEENMKVKPIDTDQATLFYYVRGKEYSIKKETATDVLQTFADHLDNEYVTTKRNWRRMEGGVDKFAAESKLQFLDGLADDFVRIARDFGAREE